MATIYNLLSVPNPCIHICKAYYKKGKATAHTYVSPVLRGVNEASLSLLCLLDSFTHRLRPLYLLRRHVSCEVDLGSLGCHGIYGVSYVAVISVKEPRYIYAYTVKNRELWVLLRRVKSPPPQLVLINILIKAQNLMLACSC